MPESLRLQGTIGVCAQAMAQASRETLCARRRALRTRRGGCRGPRPLRRASMLSLHSYSRWGRAAALGAPSGAPGIACPPGLPRRERPTRKGGIEYMYVPRSSFLGVARQPLPRLCPEDFDTDECSDAERAGMLAAAT